MVAFLVVDLLASTSGEILRDKEANSARYPHPWITRCFIKTDQLDGETDASPFLKILQILLPSSNRGLTPLNSRLDSSLRRTGNRPLCLRARSFIPREIC